MQITDRTAYLFILRRACRRGFATRTDVVLLLFAVGGRRWRRIDSCSETRNRARTKRRNSLIYSEDCSFRANRAERRTAGKTDRG